MLMISTFCEIAQQFCNYALYSTVFYNRVIVRKHGWVSSATTVLYSMCMYCSCKSRWCSRVRQCVRLLRWKLDENWHHCPVARRHHVASPSLRSEARPRRMRITWRTLIIFRVGEYISMTRMEGLAISRWSHLFPYTHYSLHRGLI